MAKKFITLNFRCGADYLNAVWTFSKVIAYYIAKFNAKSCHHVSLSVGAFTALMWKFGNSLYGEFAPAPLTTQQLNLIKAFIAAGAGLIYDEASTVITPYPVEQENEVRLNPIPEFPEINEAGNSFEDFVNAACRRMTGPFNPLTGEEVPPTANTLYGIDAAHEYLMKVGSPPHEVQHRAIIRKQNLVNWIAAWLCGVERGEFGGPCPFGPNTLPQNLTEGETQNPEDTWLESYVNDFLETPFYWICGLQTFIPIKNLGDYDDGDPKTDSEQTNLDEVRFDENGVAWCYFTMVEKAQWLLDYLKNVSPVAAKRVGAYITSKDCHSKKADWTIALQDCSNNWPHYERCNILEGEHRKPVNLYEASLKAEYLDENYAVYVAWKAEFEAWLDYIATYWMTDSDIVLFSDREAKDMVVQQYDLVNPPITVDEDRLKAIVDYLIDIDPLTTKWQYQLNEWETDIIVTRPPDFVKITIDEEEECYSLSESYWHMLSALNDIASGIAVDHKELEPVIGPCEPSVCSVTTVDAVSEEDSVYRVFVWWQHDQTPVPSFSYETILKQVPALFKVSKTGKVGPTYPDDSRQKNLRKVKALWTFMDDLGNKVDLNASEILYLLAKTLAYYYDSVNQPETFEMLPSHVLPIGYYKFLRNGRFKLIFGPENQLNWLDLGQRWTLKPAILQESYR